jgi:tripartite ATP-independent transporter DctP family solute receptor
MAVLLAFIGIGSARAEPEQQSSPTISLTLAHNAPLGGPQDIAARAFVAAIEQTMPHHFAVDVRGGITVGNDADIFQTTRVGAVDIAICSTLSYASQVPELGVLDLPFLFRDQAHAARVLDGTIGTELGGEMAKHGLMHLAFGELGIRQLTNNKHPIRTPADLAGLRMRVAPSEIYVLSFKTLGAQLVSMGIGEVYAGLRDGRIDGQENPLLVIQVNHFDDVQKYLSLSGHFYAALEIFMNASSWQELDTDEKAAVVRAAHAAGAASRAANAESMKKSVAEIRTKGLQVNDDIDRDAFIKALAPAQPEFDRRFGADLIARIRATP